MTLPTSHLLPGASLCRGTQYDATKDVARTPLKTEALATPVEQFTVRIEPKDASTGKLVMEWDKFRWTAEIRQR